MFERLARRSITTSSNGSTTSDLRIGTDLNREPVYLSGDVIPSVEFAETMLVLAKIVKLEPRSKKDNTAYQKWVEGEYVRILNERMPGFLDQGPELRAELRELHKQLSSTNFHEFYTSETFRNAAAKFREWATTYQMYNWNIRRVLFDPIVSVQKDGVFFEAFSKDESVYGRVFLPKAALNSTSEPILGTTNIDFSFLMEREFERVRSYRPMTLTVGLNSVDFMTEAATVKEEKIELPESWVRGLVEVQSVLALSPIEFEISAHSLSEVIRRLESEREKAGPRSLRFTLEPNRPVNVELEPWGESYSDSWSNYEGDRSIVVRVWGRRRLSVLKNLLVNNSKVKVRLLGDGMPSFWTVVNNGVELTVGLSGWTSNDWSSKAKFSSFVPTAEVNEQDQQKVLEYLADQGVVTTQEIADQLGISLGQSSAALQKLCLLGKSMFDPERKQYRWRDLFPLLDVYPDSETSVEEKFGLGIWRDEKLNVLIDEVRGGIRYLSASVEGADRDYQPTLELDSDNRPKLAQCNCSFYNYHKLKSGPCRHMIALALVGGSR